MDDTARFRALFEATFGAVQRYVRYRGATEGRADDLVAETFVVAWRRLDDVPVDRPLPWLLTVARNLWLNQHRATPGAARVRLHRARQRLTAELAKRVAAGAHEGCEDQLPGGER
jgi:RNA polymerase sigma-70 factor, ECF subfamily